MEVCQLQRGEHLPRREIQLVLSQKRLADAGKKVGVIEAGLFRFNDALIDTPSQSTCQTVDKFSHRSRFLWTCLGEREC